MGAANGRGESRCETAAPALFELAATLIGSGGTGISVGQSAQLIAQGVREANERLREANEHAALEREADPTRPARSWPRIGHLYLIELYLDRATEAWRALQVQATATPGRYSVADVVQRGHRRALRGRSTPSYRGADYDFITAVTRSRRARRRNDRLHARHQARAHRGARAGDAGTAGARAGGARFERPEHRPPIGRTLFQLLVPVEMEPFLGGTTEMVIELDSGTAGIPWELLDTDAGSGRRRAAVGDPHQAAAQAAHHRRFAQQVVDAERRRQRARDRRAEVRSAKSTRACPARATKRMRWPRG